MLFMKFIDVKVSIKCTFCFKNFFFGVVTLLLPLIYRLLILQWF